MRRRERSQTEQLRQALEDREAQLQEAHARLAALEGSTSLQVGRALTAAAKSPRRGLARLPRDLYRLWRGSSRSQAAGRGKAEPVLSYTAERQEARLLSGAASDHDGRLIVAGVLSAEAHAALRPYARVVGVRPHDAQIVFDSADVDLLLVTASATAPGGLWAHVGDPAVVDRTRALRWIIESASARGIPAVLVLDAPCPPGLRGLGFDHVHRGDLGIPLHRFNPVAVEPERDSVPVWIPGSAPAHGTLADLAGSFAASGEIRSPGAPPWNALPDLLRGSAGVVTDDASVAARALVCGARALLLGARPHPDFAGPALRTVTQATRPSEAARELADLGDAGPLGLAELRQVLRSAFLRHATPVRLAEILRAVSLGSAMSDAADPLAERRTALLAWPTDEATSLAFTADILNQLHPPAEVVVPRPVTALAGVERLRRQGAPLRVVDVPESAEPSPSGPSPADWARLAAATDAPWVALWRDTVGTAHIADALCAAECSGAEAVGRAMPGRTVPLPGGLEWSGADQDYVFVSAIQPDLARRELVAEGSPPEVWPRRGVRLLALGSGDLPAGTVT